MAEVQSRPRKTVEDYLALPDDVRAELIEGELYVTPAPSARHQDVVLALGAGLRSLVEARELGRIWPAPVDVYLPSGDIVQPDLVFVRKERMHIVGDAIRGRPDLAIEVLSPNRPERDRIVKKQLFAENGILEYWIVDPPARCIEVFTLQDGAYAPAGWFHGGEGPASTLRSPTFPGLRLSLATVFRPEA